MVMILQMLTQTKNEAIVPLKDDNGNIDDLYMDYEKTIECYLDNIPQDTLRKLAEQLQELQNYPKSFSEHGSHYDFISLENAYDELLAFNEDVPLDGWRPFENCWQKVLGDAQQNVPTHVAQEYLANDDEFNFNLNQNPRRFHERLLPRLNKDKYGGFWFPLKIDGLGVNFAYGRSSSTFARKFGAPRELLKARRIALKKAQQDKRSICALCKKRTDEFDLLCEMLEAKLPHGPLFN